MQRDRLAELTNLSAARLAKFVEAIGEAARPKTIHAALPQMRQFAGCDGKRKAMRKSPA